MAFDGRWLSNPHASGATMSRSDHAFRALVRPPHSPVQRTPFIIAMWAICASAIQCAGATAKHPENRPSPPNDLSCDHNADCVILNQDLDRCCGGCPERPYPISRAAVDRHRALRRARCTDGCLSVGYLCGGGRNPEDFVGVCADHRCTMREIKAAAPAQPMPAECIHGGSPGGDSCDS